MSKKALNLAVVAIVLIVTAAVIFAVFMLKTRDEQKSVPEASEAAQQAGNIQADLETPQGQIQILEDIRSKVEQATTATEDKIKKEVEELDAQRKSLPQGENQLSQQEQLEALDALAGKR
mgnify:CR=1 FL=1